MSRKTLDGMVDTNILVYAVRGVVQSDKRAIQQMCRASELLLKRLRRVWVSSVAWSEYLALTPEQNIEKIMSLGKRLQIESLDRGSVELATSLMVKYRPKAKLCNHCGQSQKPLKCPKCGLVGNEQIARNDAYIVATAHQVGAPTLYTFDGGPKGFSKGVSCAIEEPEHADGPLFRSADR